MSNTPRPTSTFRQAAAAFVSVLVLIGLAACGSGSNGGSDAGGGASGDWPDPFIVAVIPNEDQTDLDPSDSVVMTVLEEELGLNIEYHLATSYAATIEAQRSGKAHMAHYGPFSYVLASDSGVDLEPLAASADGPDDQGGYHSVASVRADSDITSLEDAKGKNVCFVDPGSTSGNLFPTAGLLEAGIDPDAGDVNRIYAGGHDASVLALVDGQCDIAFSTEGMATEQLIESGQIEEGSIKQIWTSELIPSSPTAITASVPQDLKDEIRRVYLEELNADALKDTEHWDDSAPEDEYGGLGHWGFAPVEDSDYDGIRKVCATTQAEACTSIDE